jgi:hypothetical protein
MRPIRVLNRTLNVQRAAASVGQRISLLKASSEPEIDAAFEAVVRQRADALLVGHDPIFLSRREQFVALAARYGTPAIYEFSEFVLIGGLMSYGSRITETISWAGNTWLESSRAKSRPICQFNSRPSSS